MVITKLLISYMLYTRNAFPFDTLAISWGNILSTAPDGLGGFVLWAERGNICID